MDIEDKIHLELIHNRLIDVYGESRNTDFVKKLRDIINECSPTSGDHKQMFPTSFLDKNNNRMREGDYIALTSTETMNNHYYDGLRDGTNRDPYKEWETTGTVIYLIEWVSDTLTAQRIKELGQPHPGLSIGFHHLNDGFDSEWYNILGNKHEGYNIEDYT